MGGTAVAARVGAVVGEGTAVAICGAVVAGASFVGGDGGDGDGMISGVWVKETTTAAGVGKYSGCGTSLR